MNDRAAKELFPWFPRLPKDEEVADEGLLNIPGPVPDSIVQASSNMQFSEQPGIGESLARQVGVGLVDVPMSFTSTYDYLGVLLGLSDEATGKATEFLADVQNRVQGAPDNLDELMTKEANGTISIDEYNQLNSFMPSELRSEFQGKDLSDKIMGLFGMSDEVSTGEAWSWFTLNQARMLGPTASMMVGGMGAGKLIAKGIQVGTSAAVGQSIAARAAAAGTAGVFSGFLEGGLEYQSLLKQGKSPEEASKMAAEVALGSAAITSLTAGVGIFGLAGQKGYAMGLARVASEPVEESSQQVWSNLIEGKPLWDGVGESAFLSVLMGIAEIKGGDWTFRQQISELKKIDSFHEKANLDNEELKQRGYVSAADFKARVEEAASSVEDDFMNNLDYLKFTIDQYATDNPDNQTPLSDDQKQLFADLGVLNLAAALNSEGFIGEGQEVEGAGPSKKTYLKPETLEALGVMHQYAKEAMTSVPEGEAFSPNIGDMAVQTRIGTPPTDVSATPGTIPVDTQDNLGADGLSLTEGEGGRVGVVPNEELTGKTFEMALTRIKNYKLTQTGKGVTAKNPAIKKDLAEYMGGEKGFLKQLDAMIGARTLSANGIGPKVAAIKRFEIGVDKLIELMGQNNTKDLNSLPQKSLVEIAFDMGIGRDKLRITGEEKLINMTGRLLLQHKLDLLQGYPKVTIENMSREEVLFEMERSRVEADLVLANERKRKEAARAERDAKVAELERASLLDGKEDQFTFDGDGAAESIESTVDMSQVTEEPAKKTSKKPAAKAKVPAAGVPFLGETQATGAAAPAATDIELVGIAYQSAEQIVNPSTYRGEGDVGIPVDDALFELDALEMRLERGGDVDKNFAQSPLAARLDTGTNMALRKRLKSDPKGTVAALRNALEKRVEEAPPVATAQQQAEDQPPPPGDEDAFYFDDEGQMQPLQVADGQEGTVSAPGSTISAEPGKQTAEALPTREARTLAYLPLDKDSQQWKLAERTIAGLTEPQARSAGTRASTFTPQPIKYTSSFAARRVLRSMALGGRITINEDGAVTKVEPVVSARRGEVREQVEPKATKVASFKALFRNQDTPGGAKRRNLVQSWMDLSPAELKAKFYDKTGTKEGKKNLFTSKRVIELANQLGYTGEVRDILEKGHAVFVNEKGQPIVWLPKNKQTGKPSPVKGEARRKGNVRKFLEAKLQLIRRAQIHTLHEAGRGTKATQNIINNPSKNMKDMYQDFARMMNVSEVNDMSEDQLRFLGVKLGMKTLEGPRKSVNRETREDIAFLIKNEIAQLQNPNREALPVRDDSGAPVAPEFLLTEKPKAAANENATETIDETRGFDEEGRPIESEIVPTDADLAEIDRKSGRIVVGDTAPPEGEPTVFDEDGEPIVDVKAEVEAEEAAKPRSYINLTDQEAEAQYHAAADRATSLLEAADKNPQLASDETFTGEMRKALELIDETANEVGRRTVEIRASKTATKVQKEWAVAIDHIMKGHARDMYPNLLAEIKNRNTETAEALNVYLYDSFEDAKSITAQILSDRGTFGAIRDARAFDPSKQVGKRGKLAYDPYKDEPRVTTMSGVAVVLPRNKKGKLTSASKNTLIAIQKEKITSWLSRARATGMINPKAEQNALEALKLWDSIKPLGKVSISEAEFVISMPYKDEIIPDKEMPTDTRSAARLMMDMFDWASDDIATMKEKVKALGVNPASTIKAMRKQVEHIMNSSIIATDMLDLASREKVTAEEAFELMYDGENSIDMINRDFGLAIPWGDNYDNASERIVAWREGFQKILTSLPVAKKNPALAKLLDYSMPFVDQDKETAAVWLDGIMQAGGGSDGIQIKIYWKKMIVNGAQRSIIVGFRTPDTQRLSGYGEVAGVQGMVEDEMRFGDIEAEKVSTEDGMNWLFNYERFIGKPVTEWLDSTHGGKMRAKLQYADLTKTRELVDSHWGDIVSLDDNGVPQFEGGQTIYMDGDAERVDLDARSRYWQYLSDMAVNAGVTEHTVGGLGENLATRIPKMLQGGERIDIIGQRVRREREMGVVLQVFRNPFFEVGSIIPIKDGKVFGVKQSTVYHPNAVDSPFHSWDAETVAIRNGAMKKRDAGDTAGGDAAMGLAFRNGIKKAKAEWAKAGVTEFYTAHNHPNMNTNPSKADNFSFSEMKKNFGDMWLGEIILDGDHFVHSRGDGTEQRFDVTSNDEFYTGSLTNGPYSNPLVTEHAEDVAEKEVERAAAGNKYGGEGYKLSMYEARRQTLDAMRLNGEIIAPADLAKMAIADSEQRVAREYDDNFQSDMGLFLRAVKHSKGDVFFVSRSGEGVINAINRIPDAVIDNMSREDLADRVRAFRTEQNGAMLSMYVYGSGVGTEMVEELPGFKAARFLLDANMLDSVTSLNPDATDIKSYGFAVDLKPYWDNTEPDMLTVIRPIEAGKYSGWNNMFGTVYESDTSLLLGEPVKGNVKDAPFSEEVKRRLDMARDPNTPITWRDSLARMVRLVREGFTTEIEHLPRKGFLEPARVAMHKILGARSVASYRMAEQLRKITDGMTDDQIQTVSYSLIFKDLKGQKDAGALAFEETDGKLTTAFGLTPNEIDAGAKYYTDLVQADTRLAKMAADREVVVGGIRKEYASKWAEVGLPVDNKFNTDDYWRRQVILYSQARAAARFNGAIATPTKADVLRKRKGFTKDYVTNYFLAEGEMIHSLIMGDRVAEALLDIKRLYSDKMEAQLKAQAKAEGKRDWEDLIPEGWALYQPEKGNLFYTARNITEQQVLQLMNDMNDGLYPDMPKGRKILAVGGQKPGFVVPLEIKMALEAMERKAPVGPFRLYGKFVKFAKENMLLGPGRVIKYNIRNVSGDAEAVFIGNRRLFASKAGRANIAQAAKDLHDVYFKKGQPTAALEAYLERGGLDGVLSVQELDATSALTQDLKELAGIQDDGAKAKRSITGTYKWYFSKVQKFSDFREQILRYANFLDFVEQMEQNGGEPLGYGASDPRRVRALSNKYDKAYRLSDDLLGAYDEVSHYGQWVRRNAAWFWSWQETNARRFTQMFINDINPTADEQMTFGQMAWGAMKSPVGWYGASKFVIKASALTALITLFNRTFFPDADDDLEDHVKSRLHLTGGYTADGKVMHFTRLGAVGDILEWWGLDDGLQDISDLSNGKRSAQQIIKDNTLEGANKLVQSFRPDIKGFVEVLLGMSLFPDVFNPRTIRDRSQYVAKLGGAQLAFDAASELGNKLLPSYIDPRTVDRNNQVIQSFLYLQDPLESSYHRVFEESRRFLKERGRETNMLSWTPSTTALYNMKRSLRLGDENATAHYLQQYLYHDGQMLRGSLEGVKRSLARLEPLASMPRELRRDFEREAGPELRADLAKANRWYEEDILGNQLIEEILAKNAKVFAGRVPTDDIKSLIQQSLADAIIESQQGEVAKSNRRVRSVMDIMAQLPPRDRAVVSQTINMPSVYQSAKRKVKRKAQEDLIRSAPNSATAHALEQLFGI